MTQRALTDLMPTYLLELVDKLAEGQKATMAGAVRSTSSAAAIGALLNDIVAAIDRLGAWLDGLTAEVSP